MSHIKRGTARRLGLHPPMSAAMYCFGREMSEDQMEQMREIMDRHARKAMGITEMTDRATPAVQDEPELWSRCTGQKKDADLVSEFTGEPLRTWSEGTFIGRRGDSGAMIVTDSGRQVLVSYASLKRVEREPEENDRG